MGQSKSSLRQCGYITYDELEAQTVQAQKVIDILNQRLNNTIEANRKMTMELEKNKEAFNQFKLEMTLRLKENSTDNANNVIDSVSKEWSTKIDTLNDELNNTLKKAEEEMKDELKTINDRVESWKNINNDDNNNNLLIDSEEEVALNLLKSLTDTKYSSNTKTYEVACQMISSIKQN